MRLSDSESSESVLGSAAGERAEHPGSEGSSDVLALELDGLITAYFELQREGRAPAPDEYIAMHPRHEHALRAVLPGASLLDQLGKRAEDATPLSRSGERLGEFRLLGILGRGGMGIVYDAVQEALDRPVALKVLPASRVIDRQRRERFLREAQAAASLQHPGIVPVYGVGEADGQVYYAMQRVDGVPLDVLTAAARGDSVSSESSLLLERATGLALRMHRGRLAEAGGASASSAPADSSGSSMGVAGGRPWIENAVNIGLQAAEALSYAHSRGVLHRDIKPSNLMLDDDGRVFVTDFGLCKTADGSSLTAAGDVVGTLRYVPPERFQGRDDARGDVYGLGMILYELLCGRPAFDQKNRAELVKAVSLNAPPRPRRLNSQIPEDLETIVLTATAQLPEQRYPSMEALMADLAAFQKGRAIRARAPGKLYLARLFVRRNAALVATIAIASGLFLVAGLMHVIRLRGLVDELQRAQSLAEQSTYHAEIGAAASAIAGNRESLARRHLEAVPESERDWLWRTMEARLPAPILVADSGSGPVLSGALDGDHERLVLVRESGVRVSDIASGAALVNIDVEGVAEAVFLPGADALVLLEAETRAVRAVPLDPASVAACRWFNEQVLAADVAPVESMDADGRHIAMSSPTGRVLVLSSSARADVRVYDSHPGSDAHVALFGGDGRVVHALRGERVTILGPEPDRKRKVRMQMRGSFIQLVGARAIPQFTILGPRGQVFGFDDDDSDEVVAYNPVNVRVTAYRIALHPEGNAMLVCARNGTVRIWRRGRRPSIESARTIRSGPTALLWPKGGESMIAAGATGEWRALGIPRYSQGLPGISRSRGQYSGATKLVVDREARYYAAADEMGGWALWSMERRLPLDVEIDALTRIRCIALDVTADGKGVLALGGAMLELASWDDLASGQRRMDAVAGVSDVVACGWIGEIAAERLLVMERDGRVVEVELGEQRNRVRVLGSVEGGIETARLLGASGDVLFTQPGSPELVQRFEARTGAIQPFLTADEPVLTMAVDHDARVLAIRTSSELLRAYRMAGGTPVPYPWQAQVAEMGQQRQGEGAIAVDAVGGWIVTGSSDGGCRTWSLESGRPGPELLSIFGRMGEVIFPRQNEPPMALEWRGRIDHFELDGVDRSGGVPGLEPTPVEAAALERCSAKARLESIQRHLARPDLTVDELRLLLPAASGVYFFARYNPDLIDLKEAKQAHLDADRLLSTLESQQGL